MAMQPPHQKGVKEQPVNSTWSALFSLTSINSGSRNSDSLEFMETLLDDTLPAAPAFGRTVVLMPSSATFTLHSKTRMITFLTVHLLQKCTKNTHENVYISSALKNLPILHLSQAVFLKKVFCLTHEGELCFN